MSSTRNPPPRTQLERARSCLARFAHTARGDNIAQLSEVLAEAQNRPPHGRSDGSLDGVTWTTLTDLVDAALAYDRALNRAAAQLAKVRKR